MNMSKVEMTNWNSWQEFKEANVGRSYFVTNKSPFSDKPGVKYYVVFGFPETDKKYGEFVQFSRGFDDEETAMSLAQEMNEYPYNPKQDDKMIMQQKYEIDIEDYIGRTVTVFCIQFNGTIVFEIKFDLPGELDENGDPTFEGMMFTYPTEFRPKNSI